MVQLLFLDGPVALSWWSSRSSLVVQLLFLGGPVALPRWSSCFCWWLRQPHPAGRRQAKHAAAPPTNPALAPPRGNPCYPSDTCAHAHGPLHTALTHLGAHLSPCPTCSIAREAHHPPGPALALAALTRLLHPSAAPQAPRSLSVMLSQDLSSEPCIAAQARAAPLSPAKLQASPGLLAAPSSPAGLPSAEPQAQVAHHVVATHASCSQEHGGGSGREPLVHNLQLELPDKQQPAPEVQYQAPQLMAHRQPHFCPAHQPPLSPLKFQRVNSKDLRQQV